MRQIAMTSSPTPLSSSSTSTVLSSRRWGNRLCWALLALSCTTQAFVISTQTSSTTNRLRPSVGWAPSLRGGSSSSPSSGSSASSSSWRDRQSPPPSSSSILNVMRMPPPSQTSLEACDDDDEDEEMNGGSMVDKKKQKNDQEATVSFSSSQSPVVLQASSSLLKKKNGQRKNGETTTRNNSNNNNSKPTKRYQAEFVAETNLPTAIGMFRLRAYRSPPGSPAGLSEPCVLYAPHHERPTGTRVPLRIHDQCFTSEVMGSLRCDCKEQLEMAMKYIYEHGGFIIYLQQEGRGIGIANKIAAYALQDWGMDTVDANLHLGFPEDAREYGVIPSILEDMKVDSVELMTNNPYKVDWLTSLDIAVDGTIPMVVPTANEHNRKYLETKEQRMNHANLSSALLTRPGAANGANGAIKNGMMSRRVAGTTTTSEPPTENDSTNPTTGSDKSDVQVTFLMEEKNGQAIATDENEMEPEEGVKARADGYCFGRKSVEDAIDAMRRGEMIVVVDDMDRENEGDFIMAADQCAPEDMAVIIRYSSGVICIAMEDDRLKELKLPAMVAKNEDPKGTAFTVTVDAKKEHGITTGISAVDRAKTSQLLADPSSTAADFHRPGHMLPLRARPGGVLARDGHTEAAVDLSRLAGRSPVGILCEIVSEEEPTTMMRLPEIKRFCRRHGYVLTSIVDIAQYRRDTGL